PPAQVVVTPVGAAPAAPYGATALAQPPMAAPLSLAPAPPKKDRNLVPLALFAAAIAFGITAAVLLIGRKEPPVATAPSATPTASVAAPTASVAAIDPASIPSVEQPADSNAVATNDKPATGGRPSSGGKTTSSTAKAVDPSIADLLKGGSNGPAVGGGGGGGGGSGSALTQGEIENVVNNRKTAVTRTCWEKSGGNVSAANVTCHVTIAANGSVSSTNAEGSDPVITKCIEQQVKGWQFPPSSGSTQVNLPFHFVRQ
ncbi:MAG: AgmX/PglI C-terminal domain-containing protein, partial [Polyangiaceae bacterium]